jgi:hypothetical protein
MSPPSHLACLCGRIREPATILTSQSLLQETLICHCDTCRYTTGSLGTWYLTLCEAPSEASLSQATPYKTSENYTRFFCSECGCNVFIRSERDGGWLACAGILEVGDEEESKEAQKNVSRITGHEYVGDVKDGGIAPFLSKLADRHVPCYRGEPDGNDAQAIEAEELHQLQQKCLHPPPSAIQTRGEMLQVACHCGACQLRIAPPSYTDSSEGWYVPKEDRKKYYARLCCCRSCRLTLGFTLQPWAYIPPSQIFTATEEPVVFGPKAKETFQIEKLKHYQSSEFVLRSFCTDCGATMFYQSFERPYIIDVSVGVLRSKFGNAMAAEWLEWDRSLVSKRNEAVDEELVEAWLKK